MDAHDVNDEEVMEVHNNQVVIVVDSGSSSDDDSGDNQGDYSGDDESSPEEAAFRAQALQLIGEHDGPGLGNILEELVASSSEDEPPYVLKWIVIELMRRARKQPASVSIFSGIPWTTQRRVFKTLRLHPSDNFDVDISSSSDLWASLMGLLEGNRTSQFLDVVAAYEGRRPAYLGGIWRKMTTAHDDEDLPWIDWLLERDEYDGRLTSMSPRCKMVVAMWNCRPFTDEVHEFRPDDYVMQEIGIHRLAAINVFPAWAFVKFSRSTPYDVPPYRRVIDNPMRENPCWTLRGDILRGAAATLDFVCIEFAIRFVRELGGVYPLDKPLMTHAFDESSCWMLEAFKDRGELAEAEYRNTARATFSRLMSTCFRFRYNTTNLNCFARAGAPSQVCHEIFILMCVRAKLEEVGRLLPHLPKEIWLLLAVTLVGANRLTGAVPEACAWYGIDL